MKVTEKELRELIGGDQRAIKARRKFAENLAEEEKITVGHTLYDRMKELVGISTARQNCDVIAGELKGRIAASVASHSARPERRP